jgi:hypothetical protein
MATEARLLSRHAIVTVALQDSSLRISASEFLARISDIIDGGVARHMDENCKPVIVNPNTDCGCGCCVM